MKIKQFSAAAVSLALLMTVGVLAASAGSAPSASSGSTSSNSQSEQHKGFGAHNGGDFGAFKTLTDLTGISAEDLHSKYPQKTAWQIAKQLGKLDDLKKAFLDNQKTFLDKLVSNGRITADQQAKIYADLQKRVAAIDGTATVTLGRPGYKPDFKSKQ